MKALGIGLARRACGDDVTEAIGAVLAEAGWGWEEVEVVATRRRLAGDARIVELGKVVAGFDDDALHAVAVRPGMAARPGVAVRTAAARRLGAPLVAEAAALLAAGNGSRLVVPKRTGRCVTVAAAAGAAPKP